MIERHVVPTADLVDHDTDTDDCVCGPSIEVYAEGAVLVHHSLDGRELAGDKPWIGDTP